MEAGLQTRSAKAALIIVSGEAARAVVALASTMILARLLAPGDFGLVAMVAPLLAFVGLLKGVGLGTATVQRMDLGEGEASALFWTSAAIGMGLAGMIVLSAPVVGLVYDDGRVVQITVVLALVPILHGPAAQYQALLERQMRFGRVAAADLLAAAVGAGAAVAAAASGAAYWALVVSMVSTALAHLGLVAVLCDWQPGRPHWSSEVREMFRFGRGLTGFRIVNFFARNGDDILIGRYLGADQLGLYSKAYALLLLPISLIRTPLSRVVLPVLSRLRGDSERFRRFLLHALLIVVSLSVPVIGICLVAADELIRIVLGDQWTDAVPIFRILAFAAFVQSFNVVTGWVYTALGQTDRWFRWGLISSGVVVAAFVAGLPWGIEGVAVAYAIAVTGVLYPSLRHCFQRAPLEVSDIFAAVWRPIAAGTCGVLVAAAARATMPAEGLALSRLAVVTFVFAAAYLACWSALPGGRQHLRALFSLLSAASLKSGDAVP